METGVRQLIRRRPLEVEEFAAGKAVIRVPTVEEITRVKAWLVVVRNATRDYLDVVALAERLGRSAAEVALSIDEYYQDQMGPGGRRVSTQLAKQLADPSPYDLDAVELPRYRKLSPKWRDWPAVAAACRALSTSMLEAVAREEG